MKALIKCPTCRKIVMGSVVTNPSRSTVVKAKKISEELQARAVASQLHIPHPEGPIIRINNETGECECEQCTALRYGILDAAILLYGVNSCRWPSILAWERMRRQRQERFMAAYKEISELISQAASVANDDPLTAHQLLEQAMDREYKLLGHCDDASNLRDAILGTFDPNKDHT